MSMSAEQIGKAITAAKKKRGVAKASITRLSARLTDLERSPGAPNSRLVAQRLLKNLDTYSADFKLHHLALVDLVEDEGDLEGEQVALDAHEDAVDDLVTRINLIISPSIVTPPAEPNKIVTRRLNYLRKCLTSAVEDIAALTDETEDVCLVRQREEQLLEFKKELGDVSRELLALDLEDDHELMEMQSRLERDIFDNSLKLKRMLSSSRATPTTPTSDSKSVKLPKIDVPTFSGSILHWRGFWEQFSVAVHSRSDLSDSEKLVYLRHSVKDGSAKSVIEGLSRTGEHYSEAIECLQARYNKPRLIHQAHVRKILEIPGLKEGSGKELRNLHDLAQQHLRALKAMGHEPSGPFITSTLELKLDAGTMFEWQKHSQGSTDVPHYQDLLDFINLRVQASDASAPDGFRKAHGNENRKNSNGGRGIMSFAVSASPEYCVVCKNVKHPLHSCPKFRAMKHDKMIATVKSNDICMNCLKHGHFVKQCKSLYRCRDCQKPHHSLLHVDSKEDSSGNAGPAQEVQSHAATTLSQCTLLMTCQVMLTSPNGSTVKARALLDSASMVSFISERLANTLRLPRSRHFTKISGIAGLSHASSSHFVTNFRVSSRGDSGKTFDVSAIVIPRVTCNLPSHHVPVNGDWSYLDGLQLADPDFSHAGAVDLLLGIDVFVETLLHGRRVGPPGCPVALETEFGWALAGSVDMRSTTELISCHASLLTGDELLRSFWEVEEVIPDTQILTAEEKDVVDHFKIRHYRQPDGRFVVPLPKKTDVRDLGESRSQAVRRFLTMERSLHSRKQFGEFAAVMEEYFALHHAERVPEVDLHKPLQAVFYMPMHAVRKDSSSTTKLRVVFDASAKSTSGTSLNDLLMVGPTIHPPLVDVLLRFRCHPVALTADVSKMYRAVELVEEDRDYHRFVWRNRPDEPLVDYRMKRVTFGVAASSFAANMSVKQNSIDFAEKYPLAAVAVEKSIYVDDCLTGADSVEEAIMLQVQLQGLFSEARFLLRKWNSSNQAAIEHVPPDLKESHLTQMIAPAEYTKTLGVEWNSHLDVFRLSIAEPPTAASLTKRLLTSDIAKTFDALGWFSPSTIKAKILLQRVWAEKIDWDDVVPPVLLQEWKRWRSELSLLSSKTIARRYIPSDSKIHSTQLHGFSDASEDAFAAVIYLRAVDVDGKTHTSLVFSKTRVAPLKRQTIPRLELCGAHLLSQILSHVMAVLDIPLCEVRAWTDSTVVLGWLNGDPHKFKTYVANRVSRIVELIPPSQWSHVSGVDNPADCASRGIFPSELLEHPLWWNGPSWLRDEPSKWPQLSTSEHDGGPEEERKVCFVSTTQPCELIALTRYSNYTRLKRVTAWISRFVKNCRTQHESRDHGPLTVEELKTAEELWFVSEQSRDFATEIKNLENERDVPRDSCTLALHPFLDSSGVMRVGGRVCNSDLGYAMRHPIILHGRNPLVKLMIASEHQRLLHAGPTLVNSSLGRRFHFIGQKKVVRAVVRSCIKCRRVSARPHPPLMGQLPNERASPGMIFEHVGVDYAGPLNIKLGRVRKPVIVKAYVCVFVALSVKAVHLEAVSDLTTEAFIACLRRFISRRGKPHTIWSDHGTNFVGASRELAELLQFLQSQETSEAISDFCSTECIGWKFIPEHAPHFGGLWEAAVRSMKFHLRRVVGDSRLTFEELSTVLTQVEACLNSRPLTPGESEEGIEPLTPGHFLIGRPLQALPDPPSSCQPMSILRRWNLCQCLVRQFWKRWSSDYFSALRKFGKWHFPTRNARVGDVVMLHEDGMVPTKWPMARITEVFAGKDGVVRVVNVKTSSGTYRRPVHKTALLLPFE